MSSVIAQPVIELTRPRPHVAHVWLNRPDVCNAFNYEVITTLSDTFATLSRDAMVKIIVDEPSLGTKLLIKLVTLLSARLRLTSQNLIGQMVGP